MIVDSIKISIIIPIYNVEKYIRQCLESVINQTYKNLEIIVVNDGTQDNSMKIVEEYLVDKRIRVINKENEGVASARNKGIEEATGEYISFVDSHDWLELDVFEKLISKKKGDIIIYNFKEYDEMTKELKRRIVDEEFQTISVENKHLFLWHSTEACNKLYKKNFLKENRIVFFNTLYEDVFWNIQTLYYAKNIEYLPKVYYNYRVNRPGSTMTQTKKNNVENKKFQNKKQNSYVKIYEMIENFLENNKNKMNSKEILWLKLEIMYWKGLIDYEIDFREIEKIFFKVFLDLKLGNSEKSILRKRLIYLLKNKKIIKIRRINYFNYNYYKYKILSFKILRRRIIINLKLRIQEIKNKRKYMINLY